ncbi:diacylglycerol kinase (ATP) [Thermosipho atlanticus DSM 15807]|uniref:Diacylglycerol kinase (ATP) n=1 Tax=Thermosipho atlanticus DSM 15807 TaxID=1123380 RepID=A0A1M5SR80_9BACT|nr:diacylglycerol kinase (ATP) [Thermosipho atlanticus DSM 15807]
MGSNNLKESFSHAVDGIVFSILQERNLRIHFLIGFLVLLFSLFLPIDKNDFIWIFFAVFFVILSELINTLIENFLDLFIPEYHPIVKIIKDISSGVVLWSSMFSVIVGVAVFGTYLFSWNILPIKILGFIFLSIFPFITIIWGYKKWKNLINDKR